jgi:glutathione S-transferase
MGTIDVLRSLAVTLLRAGAGFSVGELGARPEKRLQLYEFEACPFCRKVREALSILDLEADVHPCPKGGERFRPEVVRRGGKAQFPWLVDPNTGAEMYESDDIVRYLFERYGSGSVQSSKPPQQPLELWSFEASPFCRIVREKLCELEIPYVLHNVARGSPSREAFVGRSGKMQVPYLTDANTQTAMFESADIVAYLERTYGASRAGA